MPLKPTLVVYPLSVIQNWERQLEEHLKPGLWNVLVYHGPSRQELVAQIEHGGFDLILTTYQTLALEVFVPKKASS